MLHANSSEFGSICGNAIAAPIQIAALGPAHRGAWTAPFYSGNATIFVRSTTNAGN